MGEDNLAEVFLCNPNNPTGSLINPSDLSEIMDFTSSRGILVFIDEALIDFVPRKLRVSSRLPEASACSGLSIFR